MKKLYFVPLICSLLMVLAETRVHGDTMLRFRVSFGSTVVGNLDVQLFDQEKPVTVSNFLAYVDSGRFKRTFFHQLIPNVAVLGGGGTIVNPYSFGVFGEVQAIPTFPAISNEFNVGPVRSNLFGTLAMARNPGASNIHSAQATWFFNLGNNSINQTNADLNFDQKDGGLTVFGQVVNGTNLFTRLNSLSQYFNGVVPTYDGEPDLYGFYCSPVQIRNGDSAERWVQGTDVPVSYRGSYCARYADLWTVDIFRMNGPITDVSAPKASLSLPAGNANITSNSVAVSGTASDNVGVASVDVILNHDKLFVAPGATAWSVTVTNFQPGTNTLTVVANDAAGNQSKPVFRNFVRLVREPVTLRTYGHGSISGAVDQQPLDLGRNYTLTAVPEPGYSLRYWTNLVTTNYATVITFNMWSNTAISAVFIPNPFIPTKGVYNGLFAETTNSLRNERAGSFTMTLTDRGTYTAKLLRAGRTIPFSGQFDIDGSTTKLIEWVETNTLQQLFVVLDLGLTNGSCQVTGRVSGLSSPNWRAHLIADQVRYNAALNPAPQAGLYTMSIPGVPGSSTLPGGDSYATVKVDAGGKVTVAGVLADNTKFSQKTTVSKDGTWPLFSSLYKGKGLMLGWVDIVTNDLATDLVGNVDWLKTLAAGGTYYPGFLRETNVIGSKFVKPLLPTDRVVNIPDGTISFAGGNLPSDFSNQVSIAPVSTATSSSANKLTLSISTANGLMKGTIVHPNGAPTSKFGGVVLQKQALGSGFFLGTNQSGRVLMAD